MGLWNVSQRLKLYYGPEQGGGGALMVKSSPGSGTRVSFTVPYEERMEEEYEQNHSDCG
ncbi:hypothetical protein D3C75_1370430 [compost metagenome]